MTSEYFRNENGLLLQGDALECLKQLPDESVDFCMTSPPYWGQRDYGVDGQLGQEYNFKDFVQNLANIFDEVKRVLKPTGSMWVVINDTYFSTSKGTGSTYSIQGNSAGTNFTPRKYEKILQPKSLCNIPQRLSIEMTDNRDWIHRMTIIWHKKSPLPQAATDKFTRDYEQVLVFTKNGSAYHKVMYEPFTDPKWAAEHPDKPGRRMRSVWEFGPEDNDIWTINNNAIRKGHHATYPDELVRRALEFACPDEGVVLDPFMGSGTTAKVALEMGRSWIGCELNPEYCEVILDNLGVRNES